ncbi:hypothetical protein QJS66_21635 [Kocuria rhizophila]|nr:hypothetical protein QJS66_21635 [Kocuria rhizophila]
MLATAQQRVAQLHGRAGPRRGCAGANPQDGVGGAARSSCCSTSRSVRLPPDPTSSTKDLHRMYKRAGIAMMGMLALGAAAFTVGRRS